MNERIKQLAEQAKEYARGFNYQHEVFEKKFAELIVRECISALDYADGSVHHSECLLEHFGVEE